MLSPSSPAQKNLGDEDSSGSDAGSEAGLEPETDRFGFIVTNGSTAGSVGPPPELVRQREAKWINIIAQWDRILLKKTSKVKVQCQKGIPASLRAKCWPLLCGATDRMKQSENLYQSLDSQPALQSWVDVIERDLDRQFPFHEMFLSKDGHGQRGLFRVLKAYTQYQPEEGYCQAQGPVAAVLLMNMPAEEAFWCLVQISEQYLPGYYSPLLEGVLFDAAMLTWVLKRTCPAAHKHLQHHGVEPLMFATDWLMCLFTRHLPFNTLLRVWDLFFCYGVRVLLQVAVVLVRRVLGRAEQRKQCQGQMETLERLRGVREQVQEEDDSFIAEVCSVPLSARDLDKQTEKELEKWRKDRPSSTFDPRGRCYGYRMAWARARQNEEERNRKEREKGNLSIPLARSASTLSLSPSILHKKWRKGGKVNAGEWEGGGRVVRHLSMGAKEDWSSWADIRFKKVQGVQEEEDTVSEEHEEQNKPKQSEQKETTKMDTIQNIPTEHVEETVIVKEQVETRITEKEESQHKETETEESKMLSEQTEETNVETEPNQGPAKHQTVDNILQQGEELDSSSPSQVLEQQSHKSKDQDIEVKDKNKETEIQEAESEPTAAVQEHQTETQKDPEADTNTEVETEESVDPSEEQMIQADMKPEESLETENVQQTQVDTVTEVSETATETSPGSQTNGEAEAPTVKDATVETEIQEQQQEAITETQEQQQEAITETQEQQREAITETQEQQQEVITETQEQQQEAITEIQEQQQEAITETQEQQREAITETQEQQREAITETQEQQQEAITEIQEQQQEAITETQEQQREAITETQEQQREAITETQEQQREAITEIDNSSQGDAFEQKYHSTESLAETELKEEPHTQTETETDVLAQNQKQVEKHVATSDELDAEIVQIDSEQNTDSSVEAEAIILCSPECVQPKEGADLVVDTEIEVEIPVSNDTVTQSSEAFAQCSEKVVNAAASEPTEEEGEILTAHSEGDNDETQAKETPIETQMKEETTDSTEPSAQAEAVNPTAEPDGEKN
ncbi:TBC1 domain family member 10B [Dicentrarchus labrax]|uniref:TBC1 domain family, member 10C n=1 Tax=Dicentrarchus labrax TaxID=13489 RepID=A0A8P4GEU3_DICLA|nr:TBC1 domain family member 10B [Dicentrarchus labrax]